MPGAGAQTNGWISPTRGYWDDYTKWSLDVAPSTNGQTLILITNDISKTVTIDSYTADDYPSTMIISDLVVSAPGFATNTLELSEFGTNTSLQVLDTLIVTNGGALQITDSALTVSGGTNSGLSVDGSMLMEGNSVLSITPALYAALDSNASANITITGGQLFLTNGDLVVGANSAAQMILSNVQAQAWGDIFVGEGEGSTGALSIAAATFAPTYAGRFIVGMETGAVGAATIQGGGLILTNLFITLVGGDGVGQLNLSNGTNAFTSMVVGGDPGSQGTVTIAGGTTTLQAGLAIGSGLDSTGAVWLTGGQVLVTNLATLVGLWGNGTLTVSNGTWLGNSLLMGLNARPAAIYTNGYGVITNLPADASSGALNLNGGTMTLYNELVIGNCTSGGVAVVNVAGGSLYVTNATHTAFINLSSGQVNLSGGLLQADILIMTNGCGQFSNTGGTLILSNLVDGIPDWWKLQYDFPLLDPTVAGADPDGDGMNNLQEYLAGTDPTNSASCFQITSIAPSGNDLLITWTVVTNKSYMVELSTTAPTSSFTNLGTVTVPASPAISSTNYLDLGAATNGPTRFYRIQVVTSP
jgi:hypothetical protein